MAEFKEWTKEEVEEFCGLNFIEDVNWLQKFVIGVGEVSLEMDTTTNEEGNLVVVVKGKSDEN